MKHIRKIVSIIMVLLLFQVFALGVMAAGTKKGGKTTTTTAATETVESAADTSSSGEVDLSKATPEEVEEIGMAAMIEAGLISDSDISIVDVTPEDAISDDTAQNGVASALGIAGFVISIISLIGVGVLYFLCWKNGIFAMKTSKKK